jgi:secreted PhoX family phosphatase
VGAQETIVEYTAAQLAAGLQETVPNQTLIVSNEFPSDALRAPSALAFDGTGNLWIAFALDGTSDTGGVEMIAVADLAGQGTSTPLPAIALEPATFKWGKVALQSFASPDGLAFDSLGNLWVVHGVGVDGEWKSGARAGDIGE